MKPSILFLPKILILHASAGAGHRKAAEAILHGLQARHVPPDRVRIADALDFTNKFFRFFYVSGYEYCVGKIPGLWEKFFELSDQEWFQPVLQFFRRIYNGFNTAPLVKLVTEGGFEVVVVTHFMAVEVCGHLRLTGKMNARLVAVITDYDVHQIWLSAGVDLYCVACEYTRERLIALGVSPDKIRVTGIPVDEKFLIPRDQQEIRRKLGLQPNLFTLVISTSSFGFGPIEELARLLQDIQLVIICGNNKELARRLLARGNPLHKVRGFIDNMEEVMAAADVMVTKPGGLSVTEALALNVPMIFFSAIPGQEAGNVAVLKKQGIGFMGESPAQIVSEVKTFLSSTEKLAAARRACLALARPRSVEAVIQNLG